MNYQMKWLWDNLGITRKTIFVYEEAGVMPKNQNGQYRTYSEEDIDRIWTIKVLQGIGYTLKEIAAILQNTEFDFRQSISEKIEQLQETKAKIERHLGYAQMIKLTGRAPSRPRENGNMNFKEWQNNDLENWNTNTIPNGNEAKAVIEALLNQPEEQWDTTELGQALLFLAQLGEQFQNPEFMTSQEILPKAIIKRMALGANHPEVQILVKLLYETFTEIDPDITPQQYGRLGSAAYMEGDIGLSSQKRLGAAGCAFLADAIAIFGGFKNYEDSTKY